MNGVANPEYVSARRVLLDALIALEPHLEAVVLVGAQAIYVHTGGGELAAELGVAEYTTDADIAMHPSDLAKQPLLLDALTERGFVLGADIGRWVSPDGIYVDLMVPELLAGLGSRAARLGVHGRLVARPRQRPGRNPRRPGKALDFRAGSSGPPHNDNLGSGTRGPACRQDPQDRRPSASKRPRQTQGCP